MQPIDLAILGCAVLAALVALTQNRSKRRGKRMLYFVIEIAHPLSDGRSYWGRDPDRNVFKALDAQEACSHFERNVPMGERDDRRIRRINTDEFQELGGIV